MNKVEQQVLRQLEAEELSHITGGAIGLHADCTTEDRPHTCLEN